jgi:hypothetical protein
MVEKLKKTLKLNLFSFIFSLSEKLLNSELSPFFPLYALLQALNKLCETIIEKHYNKINGVVPSWMKSNFNFI